jgi:hypothetical protein
VLRRLAAELSLMPPPPLACPSRLSVTPCQHEQCQFRESHACVCVIQRMPSMRLQCTLSVPPVCLECAGHQLCALFTLKHCTSYSKRA